MNRAYQITSIFLLAISIIQHTNAFDIQSYQKVQSTIQSINNNPPPALLLRAYLKTN